MRQYNAPPATPSQIGNQMHDFFYFKKALIEAQREQYFLPLADVRSMPKNMGKTIKQYHYMPLLDERNINDQGIDAAGVTISSLTYTVFLASSVASFVVEADATAAAAAVNAIEAGTATKSGVATPWQVTFTKQTLDPTTLVLSAAATAANPGSVATQNSGNFYGSSKDIGSIPAKFPMLSETGGRVNRVGFKRIDLEGTFEKYGFFDEYTQASVDFDSDSELRMHVSREMIYGASEMTEDMVQIDLINNAGTIKYSGAATSIDTIDDTTVTYRDLLRLHLDLSNNRTPLQTKIMTGTRMIDTKTIPGSRIMYIGHELQPLLEEMKDFHEERAFIPVQKYGAGLTALKGEIGSIGYFRFVVNPEMMNFTGAGGDATGLDEYYSTNGRLDVFPMLVIGEGSFTTIGFQTDGKKMKFTIYHKKPGEGVADRFDPYGETGFMSIKWWYGFMLLRGERLAIQYSAGKM